MLRLVTRQAIGRSGLVASSRSLPHPHSHHASLLTVSRRHVVRVVEGGGAVCKKVTTQDSMDDAIAAQTKEQYELSGAKDEPLAHYCVRHDNWVAITPLVRTEGPSLLHARHPTNHTTPLMLAAQLGRLWCIDTITEADPETILAVDRYGRSALHFAAVYGNTGAVSTLLDKGAVWSRVDQATMACIKANPEVHQLLLRRVGATSVSRTTVLDENPKKPSLSTKFGRVLHYYRLFVVPYSIILIGFFILVTMDEAQKSHGTT